MKKRVIFFSGISKSHIYPLDILIQELKAKGNDVYILNIEENRKLIEQIGGSYIEYPFKLHDPIYLKDYLKAEDEMRKLNNEAQFVAAMEKKVESDALLLMETNKDKINKLKEIIVEYDIDIVFSDSVDKFAAIICQEMGIINIGYITHNLYSKNFFESNPDTLYKIFMRMYEYQSVFPLDFFKNFRAFLEKVYSKVLKEKKTSQVRVNHQFDPETKLSLIFSTNFFQPKESFVENREFLIIPPNVVRFKSEQEVEEKYKNFIKKFPIIIYIASGGIISYNLGFYKNLIEEITKTFSLDFGCVISSKDFYEELREYCFNHKISNFLIEERVPQKYILQHSNLIITAGGQNTIMEAIFCKVPLLVAPLTSEQRINALMVKKLKIGDSIYPLTNQLISKKINEILENNEIQRNILHYSKEIEKEFNNKNFNVIFNYLEERK